MYVLLPLGVFAASSAAVLIRMCDAPPLVIAAYRLGIASVLLLPIAAVRCREEFKGIESRDRVALLLSGIFLGLHFALWITSLSYTSVASSVLLVTTSPIFLGLGGWLLLREKIDVQTGIGIATSLVGTGIVTMNDWGVGQHAFSGDVMALGGAVAISGHLMIGRHQRQQLGLIPYITVVNTTAAASLICISLAFGHDLFGYDNRTYMFFALLALGPQLLGHTSFNYALKRVPPVVIALALLAEPIGSAALAYVVLAESPGTSLFAGGAVILCGIGLAIWPRASAQGGP